MQLSSWPFLAALVVSQVQAHMQMSHPYPIDSQYNPEVPESLKDYSYTSPLLADGSNFPCKGYQNQRPLLLTASYTAGGSYVMTLYGSAMHDGGSCQISLSYDNGKTFRVIKSMIGGCPLVLTYDFTIPSFAPAGVALLAWTWMNEVGNREYYMNCAWVEIAAAKGSHASSFGPKSPFNGPPHGRHPRHRGKESIERSLVNDTLEARETFTSFDQLPFIWKANLPPENNCVTVEGVDPVFTNPGPDVLYGNGLSASSPTSQDNNCDSEGPPGPAYSNIPLGNYGSFSPSGGGGGGNGGSGSSSSQILPTTTSSSSTATETATRRRSKTRTRSTLTTVTSPTIATTPSPTLPSQPSPTLPSPTLPAPQPGAKGSKCDSSIPGLGLKCLRKGLGFAICDHDVWVDMGATAYGTKCSGAPGAAIIVANNGG